MAKLFKNLMTIILSIFLTKENHLSGNPQYWPVSNLDPHDLLWEDTIDTFEKLEVHDNIDHTLSKSRKPTKPKEDCKYEQSE